MRCSTLGREDEARRVVKNEAMRGASHTPQERKDACEDGIEVKEAWSGNIDLGADDRLSPK
jgi:hypothetical protein